jgi:hypothetical protein
VHPNHDAVQEVVEFVLSRHIFRGWRLEGIRYDAQHAAYDLVCSNGSVTVTARIVSEWVDEALGKGIPSRRRIKHALRDAFKIQAPDDDDA